MFKKSVAYSLISGLLLSLAAGCGSRNTAFAPQQQFNQMQNVNSFAKRNDAGGETLTVATYNIRNLFDGIQNPGKEPEKAKPEKELIALAKAIETLNADVIAMQEVESKPTLQKFLDKYLPNHGYQVVLVEAYDARGIDVALISRIKVNNVKSHKDVRFPVPGQTEQEGFSRDLLQVDLTAKNGYNFSMFVTHLKSKHGGEESSIKREAEAQKISEILQAFHNKNPKANFILTGDFNDTPESKPLRPILAPMRSGLKLNDIIMEDMGNASHVYTYHPKAYRSRIDYILTSPGMEAEYIRKSVEIHKTNTTARGEEDKWIYFEASDHLPTTAKFNISQDL